eukprot:6211089-Pleurochrysis_carterae.AAC.4
MRENCFFVAMIILLIVFCALACCAPPIPLPRLRSDREIMFETHPKPCSCYLKTEVHREKRRVCNHELKTLKQAEEPCGAQL